MNLYPFPMPALIPLRSLVVVALVAQRLIPDVTTVLAEVSRANFVAAIRTEGKTPRTRGQIEAAATEVCGADRFNVAAEAVAAVRTFREATEGQIGWYARRLDQLIEVVERAAEATATSSA